MVSVDLFLPFIRPDVPNCPDFTIRSALIRAARKFCSETQLITEDLSLSLVDGQKGYTLTPTSGFNVVAITKVAYGDTTLYPIDRATAYSLTGSASPTAYSFENTSISFLPTPDGSYSVTATVAVMPDIEATTVSDELYDVWLETILCGAREILMAIPEKEWTNIALAADHGKRFSIGLRNGKAVSMHGSRANTGQRVKFIGF